MSTRDWRNHEPPAGYATRKAAAAMMGVTPRTFSKYIRDGKFKTQPVTDPIPGIPWTFNETFYKIDDIVKFLEGES